MLKVRGLSLNVYQLHWPGEKGNRMDGLDM